MSSQEPNHYYFNPLKGQPRDGKVAPSSTPAGTFGASARFGPSPESAGHAARARSPSVYVPSARRPSSVTPARLRGYADLALARTTQTQGGMHAPRSKTPAATRHNGQPSTTYPVLARRAATPARLASTPAAAPTFPARPATAVAGTGRGLSRRPQTPGGSRGLAFDAATVPRIPAPAPAAALSQAVPAPERPYTSPTRTTPAPGQRRLAYGGSTAYPAPRAAHPAAAAGPVGGSAAGSSVPQGSNRPRALDAEQSAPIASRDQFQDPGDDWLTSYDRPPVDVLRGLQHILGGLSRLSGLTPAPMEARAPPRQLPSPPDLPLAPGRPNQAQLQPPPPASGGDSDSAYSSTGRQLQGAPWYGTGQAVSGVSLPYPRPAWAEPGLALSPTLSRPAMAAASAAMSAGIPAQIQPSTMSALMAQNSLVAGAPGSGAVTITTTETTSASTTTTAAAASTAGVPESPLVLSGPAHDLRFHQAAAGTSSGRLFGSPGGVAAAAAQPTPATGTQLASESTPLAASSAAGSSQPPVTAAVAAPVVLPSSTIAELWSVVQAYSQKTSRLMADLAAAKREAELANERAEEADSLARAFQQQLIFRHKSLASWQSALAEMEEREAAARKELLDLQERCEEQAKRAEQAEHVAITAQLRLERLMEATHRTEPSSEADRPAGRPPQQQQLQQQLEHLQADLAAARTRATRAELQLAVARNKALIAQQEMSAEEERARRAAAAAAAAREELGRTRAAMEMMGLDHDRLQNKLADLRGKIGDAVGWPAGSSTTNLLDGPCGHRPQRTQQTALTPQPSVGALRLPVQHTEHTTPTKDSHRRLSLHSGTVLAAPGAVATAAAAAGAGAGPGDSRRPAGAIRDMYHPPPGSSGDGGQGGQSAHKPPLRSGRSSATRSSSSNNSSSGACSRSSSPRRQDAAVRPRRRRRGSVLLVAPGEMPADASASVRYGPQQRTAMRRQNGSQDVGVLESPSGGDEDADGYIGVRGRGADGALSQTVLPPRTISGSHDGIVRRIHVGECGAGEAVRAAAATAGSNDGKLDLEGAAAAVGAHRGAAMTQEMLSLTRTPSSGRRRRPSLRTSNGSISRDGQVRASPAAHHALTWRASASDGSATSSTAGSVQTALMTPEKASRDECEPVAGKLVQAQVRHPGQGDPPRGESPSAATGTWSNVPSVSSASSTAPVQPSQQQQQQQQNNNRQGGVTVSLADLRRQMAAAEAEAVGAAPETSQASQRQTPRGPTAAAAAVGPVAKARTSEHPAAGTSAAADKDSRSSSSQPRLQQWSQVRTNQNQTTPDAAAHASPGASAPTTATTVAATTTVGASLSKRMSTLPPLEQSKSLPERSLQATTAADNGGIIPSHSPAVLRSAATPQPAPLAVTAATAAAAAAAAATAPGKPELLTTPSYRAQGAAAAMAAAPPRPSRLRSATAVDPTPPKGYNTSHINGLYESMQSRGSWGIIPDVHALAPPPATAAATAATVRRERDAQRHGTLAASPPLHDQAAGSAAYSLPSGRPLDIGQVIHADATALGVAFTARTRMLSPSQVGSFVVNPSLTNSITTEASFEDILPAASTAQPWKQRQPQLQQQPHLSATITATVDPQRAVQVAEPSWGLTTRSALLAHPVGVRALEEAESAGAAGASDGGRASGLQGGHTHRPAAADGAAPAATGGNPRQRGPPWWQRLLPRRRRRANARSPGRSPTQHPSSPVPSAVASARAAAGHPSISQLRIGGAFTGGGGANVPVQRAGSSRSRGHTGSTVPAAGKHEGAEPANGVRSPVNKSRRLSLSGGGGDGRSGSGKARLFWSAVLHFGMWSGGMAAGVVLVLGLAGLVEVTLGGPVGGGNLAMATPGGEARGPISELQARKGSGQDREKGYAKGLC